jgi:hypothetical protein
VTPLDPREGAHVQDSEKWPETGDKNYQRGSVGGCTSKILNAKSYFLGPF